MPIKLITGRGNISLAEAVSKELNVPITPTIIKDFANGEIYVHFKESVRGANCFVMQSHFEPMNKNIMEQLIMIDALKRASAKSISAIIPFYGYSRQDKKHKGREPITAKLIADLLTTAGANRILSLDLHSAQIQGFFNIPFDHLWAMPVLVNYIRKNVEMENVTVVSPDAGRVRLTDIWAKKLSSPIAIIHKKHNIEKLNEVSVHEIVGNVKGRTCILVDDMIDTAGTITKAVAALKENGAKKVILVATHGIFSDPAIENLKKAPIDSVVVTNSVPIEKEKQFEKLKIVSIAPIIAKAIHEVYRNGSVTSLFNDFT